MKYYKYLSDLPWQPVTEKLKWYLLESNTSYLANTSVNMWRYADRNDLFEKVPELQELFKPMGLTIHFAAFFVSENRSSLIHIDADKNSNARINLPVLNCENTETRFYKSDYPPVKRQQPDGINYWYIDPVTCTHVDSFFLNEPVIFKVNEPHQVIGESVTTIPRVSCTIGFTQEIIHLIDK